MTKVLIERKNPDKFGVTYYAFIPEEGEKIKSWDVINRDGSGLVEVEVVFDCIDTGKARSVCEFFALDEVSRIREIRHVRMG